MLVNLPPIETYDIAREYVEHRNPIFNSMEVIKTKNGGDLQLTEINPPKSLITDVKIKRFSNNELKMQLAQIAEENPKSPSLKNKMRLNQSQELPETQPSDKNLRLKSDLWTETSNSRDKLPEIQGWQGPTSSINSKR